MAYSVSDNTPAIGYIAWANLHIVYEGVDYTIVDGNTDKKFIYWDKSVSTTVLQTSDTLPTLLDEDVLIFLNKSGTHATVPITTVVDGSLIVSESILTDALAANCVTSVKILAGAVIAEKIGAGEVTAIKIAAGAIETAKIAALAVETDKIAANAVTAAKIAAGTITAAEIAALAIGADQIAANAVTAAKINALAVETDKIAANAVTAAKMAVGTITAASGIIADLAVETLKIADVAVTADKIASSAVQTIKIQDNAVTIPTSAYTSGAIEIEDTLTTVQEATFTATGSSVFISFSCLLDTDAIVYVTQAVILRDAVTIYDTGAIYILAGTGMSIQYAKTMVDTPAAGSHTYYIQLKKSAGSATFNAFNRSLYLQETKK